MIYEEVKRLGKCNTHRKHLMQEKQMHEQMDKGANTVKRKRSNKDTYITESNKRQEAVENRDHL